MDILERGVRLTESKVSALEALSTARAYATIMNKSPQTSGWTLQESGYLFWSPNSRLTR